MKKNHVFPILSFLLLSNFYFYYFYHHFKKRQEEQAKDSSFLPPNQRESSIITKESSTTSTSTSSINNNSIVSSSTITTSSTSTSTTPFSYVYLMAGCNPANPKYLGYIYNVVVSSKLIRDGGSKQDIVVLIRMATSTDEKSLPEEHSSILEAAGIIIKYVPKVKVDNFVSAQLDKFRVLELIEYDRVLYMDSDVMAYCSLDYMFEKSISGPEEAAVLRGTTILAYNNEPAHGGLFMLEPSIENYNSVREAIEWYFDTYRRGNRMDYTMGWGHNITAPDKWQSRIGKTGTNWGFYGGIADQGLLYYWSKYKKRDTSIIIQNKVETWSRVPITNDDGKKISKEINKDLHMVDSYGVLGEGCNTHRGRQFAVTNVAPYSDFKHFSGRSKPWLMKPIIQDENDETPPKDANGVWWSVLLKEIDRLHLKPYDVELMKKLGRPSLGIIPTWNQIDDVGEEVRGELQ